MMAAMVNGELCNTVSAHDRGLAFGDGVFRTLRCQEGRLWAWRRHYAKLEADCAALGLECPAETLLLEDIAKLAPHDAAIKLIVTRGESARGYACMGGAPVTRIVLASPLPIYDAALFSQGATLRLCDWPLTIQPRLAGIKHLNRLDQVMARREWNDSAIFDGLMRNLRNEWVEGVISNLFLLNGEQLITHPLADCGVAGVARSMVLDLCAENRLQLTLMAPSLDQIVGADEVFLSNSLAGIVPVGLIAERKWAGFSKTLALREQWINMGLTESVKCMVD
jgi:4-amino-4-deoxychorismate lyase